MNIACSQIKLYFKYVAILSGQLSKASALQNDGHEFNLSLRQFLVL